MMSRKRRPYRSAVQAAFRVNRIPQVAFKALIKLIVLESLKIFLYNELEYLFQLALNVRTSRLEMCLTS